MLAAFTSLIVLCPAAFADTDFCSGGILDSGAPLGQQGPDLDITNMTCTVDGTKAPYNFHNYSLPIAMTCALVASRLVESTGRAAG